MRREVEEELGDEEWFERDPDGQKWRRLARLGDPGRIWETNLGRHIATPPQTFDPTGARGVSEKSVAQGAATSVLLAASPLVASVTGVYFEDCREAEPFVPGVRRGVADYALDPENARRLWELSVELTGVDG